MTKPVAIVTRKWPEENEKRLKELFDVTLNESDKPFTSDELKSALQNCDVSVSYTHLTLPTKA